MSKRPRNKAKAAKVVKSLISNDLNQAAAARELGVTQQAVANHVKDNPLVRSALQKYHDALEKAGATDEKSARVISEAMDAMRKVGLGHGEDFTVEQEEDHHARLKANDQYLKVKKLLADSAPPAPSGGQHLHFHYEDKKTNELLGEIAAQLTTLGKRKLSLPRRSS